VGVEKGSQSYFLLLRVPLVAKCVFGMSVNCIHTSSLLTPKTLTSVSVKALAILALCSSVLPSTT
jgi:hypothetical protein